MFHSRIPLLLYAGMLGRANIGEDGSPPTPIVGENIETGFQGWEDGILNVRGEL